VPSQAADGRPQYELRLTCGQNIIRLHYFSRDEIEQLEFLTGGGPPPAQPADAAGGRQAGPQPGRHVAGTGSATEGSLGHRSVTFRADPPPQPQGGGFCDPD
jgi:hypothetical protein